MNYNHVMILGTVSREPTINKKDASTWGRLPIMVISQVPARDGGMRDERCYIDVEVNGYNAERCAQQGKVGAQVFVDGYLKLTEWADKATGTKRTKHVIVADKVRFETNQESFIPQKKGLKSVDVNDLVKMDLKPKAKLRYAPGPAYKDMSKQPVQSTIDVYGGNDMESGDLPF